MVSVGRIQYSALKSYETKKVVYQIISNSNQSSVQLLRIQQIIHYAHRKTCVQHYIYVWELFIHISATVK